MSESYRIRMLTWEIGRRGIAEIRDAIDAFKVAIPCNPEKIILANEDLSLLPIGSRIDGVRVVGGGVAGYIGIEGMQRIYCIGDDDEQQ